jgi:membrane protein required for colicin V production
LTISDIVLVILIILGAYSGYRDGFIVSLFSLVAIVLGMLGGFKLMGSFMILLSNKYNIDEKVLPYLAFGLVFIIIVIAVNLLGKLIKTTLDKSILGWFDKGAGALFGTVRMAFMISILLWIIDSLKVPFPKEWVENSWLHTNTANFAPMVTKWVGGFLPIFKDIF